MKIFNRTDYEIYIADQSRVFHITSGERMSKHENMTFPIAIYYKEREFLTRADIIDNPLNYDKITILHKLEEDGVNVNLWINN